MDAMNTRLAAVKKVLQWMAKQSHADELLRDVVTDRAAICERVYGVIRRYRSLCWMIERYARKSPGKRIEAVLAVGLYELCWMNEPQYATVHQCVQAAKSLTGPPAARFVNALLRRAASERDLLLRELERQPPGIRYSFPDILLERWTVAFGEDATLDLCRKHNETPETVLHPLSNRTDIAEWVKSLEERGIQVKAHPFRSQEYFILPSGIAVPLVPGYREGYFIVQDPAAAPAVEMLAPQPGEKIWDVCAAPGGKTMKIAAMMKGQGALTASDAQQKRIERLQENLRRVGAEKVLICLCDARRERPRDDESYDGILLDVPCTNTGVLRRRPDARWRFSSERLELILKVQRELIAGVASAVRPGGRLVYSTCSLEPEENRGQIDAFLECHSDFILDDEFFAFPPVSGADGSYAALLKRN